MSRRSGPNRFYVPELDARADGEGEGAICLPAGEAHHAARVLRLKPGQPVELFDGRGRRAAGRIAGIARGNVTVSIEQVRCAATRPEPIVHLAFAAPKGKRLGWLLEKATELGAASLRPVVFRRSVAAAEGLTAAKRQRWQAHCVAAAKQCGLDFLPEIAPVSDIAAVVEAAADTLALLGDPNKDARTVAEALAGRTAGRAVSLLVGPEGGLGVSERAALVEGGFVPVRLGRTTLRIETAAVAMLAVTIALPGDRS